MAKFRRRAGVVEAEQFFPLTRPLPHRDRGAVVCMDGERWYVTTIHEEQATLAPGDWVVLEPDGRHAYPVKPKIFDASYVLVGEATGATASGVRLTAEQEAIIRGTLKRGLDPVHGNLIPSPGDVRALLGEIDALREKVAQQQEHREWATAYLSALRDGLRDAEPYSDTDAPPIVALSTDLRDGIVARLSEVIGDSDATEATGATT